MYRIYKATNSKRGTKFYPTTMGHSDKDQAIIQAVNMCGKLVAAEQIRHKRATIRVVDNDYANKLVFEVVRRNDVLEAYAVDKRNK